MISAGQWTVVVNVILLKIVKKIMMMISFKHFIIERGKDGKGHYISTEKGAGMTQKGVDAVNRKTGGNLKTAVTGKVKAGSAAAGRRKSFCARMSGNKGPMKDDQGRPTRKAMSLRRWKC
jgi:hypothetical protein|tara:strand:+ start:122 stop:481 length:360 start_codon:yes stop_codon:yes gene_type:complete